MTYDTITYDLNDGVAVVTLNRADKMNALNTQMRAEITDAVRRAGNEARCVVLTGAGKAFCSGQDLGDRANASNIDMERTLRDEYEPMLNAIVDCPVPTISAVNGPAAGAGANLALAADVVIASRSAYFLQAFSKIGLIPDAGGTWTLPRTIGLAKAMGTALFAEKVTADQASDWGMIWEAVDDAAFVAHWQGRAAHLAAGPTKSYKGIKDTMRASFGNSLEEQLRMEAKTQAGCGNSRDFKEGVLAFLEKRAPKFEGR
ncbi:MAG: enoyl-CoA hydratase-related protein [Maritimibacter sp.]